MNDTSTSKYPGFLSIRTRVVLGFISLTVLVTGLTLTIVFLNFRNQLRESLKSRLESIVAIAALQQNGDSFSSILSAEDEEYLRVQAQNTAILHSDPDLVFVYTMRFDIDGLYFVVDAGDPANDGFSQYGTRYYEPGPVLLENYSTIQEPMSETDFYEDEYGQFLSAYAPIRDQFGRVVGIIAADISANQILASESRLLFLILGVFLGTLPLITLFGWFLGRNMATPVIALTRASTQIAGGDINFRPPINTSIPEIRRLKESFYSMADQQRSLIEGLEKRVADRTEELSVASTDLQRRANQMQTISEVAHSVSLVQDTDQLLGSIVNIISERFSFYHIGIFLLDLNSAYAVLKASNSEGGKRMLARGHRLKVGEVGIVGYVASSGKPRIALDVGQDSVFFNNPDLADTRSEMALPLLVRGNVIGVLDIQSMDTSAFKETEFDVFLILANQVAVALENARLFSETRKSLAELEKTYSEYVKGEWAQYSQRRTKTSLQYSARDQKFTDNIAETPGVTKAMETGQTTISNQETSSISIPLRIRDEVIGVLEVKLPDQYHWKTEDITTLQRIAERSVLALENARLYEEAQKRVSKEHVISNISSKISTSINIRNVLQTAVEELGRAMPGSNITIQLDPSSK